MLRLKFYAELKHLRLVFAVFLSLECNHKKSKSDIDTTFVNDTLHVGYTYWWPESGPFLGNCGDELSLVFVGTLSHLDEPNNDPGPLYTAQKGVVEINRVLKIKDLGEKKYHNQKFMTTDCYYKSGLSVGDKVLVICYDYDTDYSIPGQKSLLKIDSFDDDLVASIRAYIDADENPLTIKNDIALWSRRSLGRALEGVIACRQELQAKGKDRPAAE